MTTLSDNKAGEETAAALLHITDADFEETVLGADKPVLVDFWAPWCGPCRMVGPIVEELAEEYEGKAVIAKLNTDENSATPNKYSIRGIPTLILFNNGKEVERIVGARPKQQFSALLDKALGA